MLLYGLTPRAAHLTILACVLGLQFVSFLFRGQRKHTMPMSATLILLLPPTRTLTKDVVASFSNAPPFSRPFVPLSCNDTGATPRPRAWCCWSRMGRPPPRAETRVCHAAVCKAASGEGACKLLEEPRPCAHCGLHGQEPRDLPPCPR